MSWTYWGIVISLVALVVMLIACIRLLSSNGNKDRQEPRHNTGRSVDTPTINRRAA